MPLTFDSALGTGYTSKSQKARVLTEYWAQLNGFCPACGSTLRRHSNNQPAADLFCSACNEDFELKSMSKPIGAKIVDGAYETMAGRLVSNQNPNLFLLQYNPATWCVRNFLVVPKHFFTLKVIEKRPPLSASARRAGWVGCNILYKDIPMAGKIHIVTDGVAQLKQVVIERWQRTNFLATNIPLAARGWLLDVMTCIERLGKREFLLDEIYRFTEDLQTRYPDNRHIKAKIRQQLQVLRDNGYLSFVGRGAYRLN